MPARRELAIQISEQFRALSSGMTFRDAVVIGGVDMQAQAKELSRRPHVVVATPGRLKVRRLASEGRQQHSTLSRRVLQCSGAHQGPCWPWLLVAWPLRH